MRIRGFAAVRSASSAKSMLSRVLPPQTDNTLFLTNDATVRTSRVSVLAFSISGSSTALTLSLSSWRAISIFSLKLKCAPAAQSVLSQILMFFITYHSFLLFVLEIRV